MRYMGSKSKIKKDIVPILQKIIDDNNITYYIEPFVGGANVIDSIRCKNRIGADIHDKLIALLKYVQNNGELPESVSKELYDDVRDNKDTNKYEDWFVGAIGVLSSYNGKYFGGYAKTIISKTGVKRNYYDESKRNLEKQRKDLIGIKFDCCLSLLFCVLVTVFSHIHSKSSGAFNSDITTILFLLIFLAHSQNSSCLKFLLVDYCFVFLYVISQYIKLFFTLLNSL